MARETVTLPYAPLVPYGRCTRGHQVPVPHCVLRAKCWWPALHRGPMHTCPAAGEGSPCWLQGSPPCVRSLGWAVTLLVLSLLSLLKDEPGQHTGKRETLHKRAGGPSRANLEQPASVDPQLTTGAGASPAQQAPPSMGFSRQEYWSGVPLPSPQINYTSVKKKKS